MTEPEILPPFPAFPSIPRLYDGHKTAGAP